MKKDDEEIKEEIEVYNDFEEPNNKMLETYDKFLLESVAFEGKNKNQFHSQLKNQMKNIIYDIKEKKAETLKNKNSKKLEILKNLSSKLDQFSPNEEEENNMCNCEGETKLNIESKDEPNEEDAHDSKELYYKTVHENIMKESKNDSGDKLYGLNLDEFIKENHVQYDNDELNQENFSEHNMNGIGEQYDLNDKQNNHQSLNNQGNQNFNNTNAITNQNETVDIGVEKPKSLKEQISENYEYFLRKNDKKKAQNNATNHYAKPTINAINKAKPGVIVVDSYQNDEERDMKNKKIERLRQQKIKKLESINNQKRAKSKTKSVINKNEHVTKISAKLPEIKKEPRPTTAKSIPTKIAVSNNRPNTTKTTITSNNTTINESHMSRKPIRIIREESIVANQKIRNIKCNKMSNKAAIKKAIKEVCLAGPHYKESRDKILEIIDSCDSENYVILFRGNYGFYLRGVYTHDLQTGQIELLTCINNAPDFIDSSMIETYYKYNVSQNQFKELKGNKEFSVIVDGVTIGKK